MGDTNLGKDARHFLPIELHIGIPEIDAQHEALFARLVYLKHTCLEEKRLPRAEAEALLDALREHYVTEEHFAQKLQMDFSVHVRQHEVMLRAVSKTLNEVLAGRANVFSLLRYLEYWFERHIADEDMVLGHRLSLDGNSVAGNIGAFMQNRSDELTLHVVN